MCPQKCLSISCSCVLQNCKIRQNLFSCYSTNLGRNIAIRSDIRNYVVQITLPHVPFFAGGSGGWWFKMLLLLNRQIIMYIEGQIIRFLRNFLDHAGRVKSYTIRVIQPRLICFEYPWFCHMGLEAGALSSREIRLRTD